MDNFTPEIEKFVRIRVVGVGGGGSNAVTRMVETGLQGVDFIIVNSDAQALTSSKVRHKIQIGPKTTNGLGAGADPGVGLNAAQESAHEIEQALEGSEMVFITVGMGGGTGTGASPVVADIARSLGALTVGVVTKPFSFEGKHRRVTAEEGIGLLKGKVDTLIVIPNDKLLGVAGPDMKMVDAFRLADAVLHRGVQGISDLITVNGLINLDFADIKTVMSQAGTALIGLGEGRGEHRAVEAAQNAITSPLLEYSIEGAQRILLSITGGKNMTLHEVNAAAEIVSSMVDENANIIFGSVIDETMEDRIRITVLAAGFGEAIHYKDREKDEKDKGKGKDKPIEISRVESEKQPVVKNLRNPSGVDLGIPHFLREP